MPSWIDFKELRAELSFEAVLKEYGVELNLKNGQHLGFCPLPSHEGRKRSPSFSANMDRKIFHCFGCQAKGNILDFVSLMEKADPNDGRALKKIAIDLRERFCPGLGSDSASTDDAEREKSRQLEIPAIINPPLDFELQGLDCSHPYLRERGFKETTSAMFGVGFCERGSLAGRIAIPLHDAEGKLVGYAGRVIDDSTITDENPRYRFPSVRERDGSRLAFKKTLFLYNGHRIKKPQEHLGVVEGFPSVWWYHQHGYPAVATMGAECSDEQVDLIVSLVKPKGHVWIVPDGDKAGEKFAQSLLVKLAPHRFVRWVKLSPGRQPTHMTPEEMKTCFSK